MCYIEEKPFYVSTTTSVPRDVVVALDISNTMRGNKLNEARRAVLTVLETLSVKDNFGVVVFNDKAQTLDGCYEKQLVPATSTTKKKFIDCLSSESGEDQILLFVTGGENIKGNPLEIIRDENEALQNRVVIHTFGVGIGESFIADLISILKCNKLGTAEKELLRDMAQQTMNNNSYGYVKT